MTPLVWLFSLLRVIGQSVLLALGQIWANKTRSILTTIGIIIGVASVTAVIAALTGMKTKVLKDFESIGTTNILVFPHWPRTGLKRHVSWQKISFAKDDFDDLLEHCPSLKTFTRQREEGMTARAGDESVENVRVNGVDPAWHEILNRHVVMGRPLMPLDGQLHRPVCLISEKLRDELKLDRDCIGATVYLDRSKYTVVGMVEPPTSFGVFGTMGQDYFEAIVPFEKIYRIGEWYNVIAQGNNADVTEDAGAEMRFYLRRQRQLRPDEPDTFRIESVESYLRKFKEISNVITLVAAGIVSISLLVGGVGIMNIMLVSVSERTREIGLRKAVGARPSAIMLQFLVEAVMLCFFGGFLGLLGGSGLTAILQKAIAQLDQAHIPGWAVALAFGFSALVGISFGLFPALKAARLDPIEALRHE